MQLCREPPLSSHRCRAPPSSGGGAVQRSVAHAVDMQYHKPMCGSTAGGPQLALPAHAAKPLCRATAVEPPLSSHHCRATAVKPHSRATLLSRQWSQCMRLCNAAAMVLLRPRHRHDSLTCMLAHGTVLLRFPYIFLSRYIGHCGAVHHTALRSVQRPALSIGSTTNQSAAAVCVCAVVLSHHTASCRATIVQGLPQSIQWSQWSHTLDAAMHRQRQSNYGLLLPEARTSATAAAARIGSSAVARMRWLDCGGSTAVARQRWHDSGGSTGACKGAGKYSRGN